MVALVRDICTDAPLGIHRTAISPDGHKNEIGGLSRMTLGPTGNGAVKLSPDADVETCLGLGEGLETVLSLRDLPGLEGLPIWAVLAANRLAAFPILAGIEGLWLAVDNDQAGVTAAGTARARWQAAGIDVVTATPRAFGADLNDIVRGRRSAS